MNLYDKDYFELIKNNTKIYSQPYELIKDFIGCYPIYKNNKIIDFKLILPTINSIQDELIYVHEYSHALFLDDSTEIFPNIMEAKFINKYVYNKELKEELINNIQNQLEMIEDFNHRIGVKIKLINIK